MRNIGVAGGAVQMPQPGTAVDLGLWRGAVMAVVLVLFYCVLALLGWISGVEILTSILPGLARTSVGTALGCILCGVALLAGAWRLDARAATALRVVPAAVVLISACYVLIGYLPGVLPAGTAPGYLFGPHNGRVAIATATNFVLLSAAILLWPWQPARLCAVTASTAGLIVSFIALLGYAFGVQALYAVLPFAAMALPTALAFALLFLGALMLHPDRGWMARIVAPDSGGVAARTLIPAIVLIPVAVSWLVVRAHTGGVFAMPFGFAVVTVVTIVLLGFVTSYIAAGLSRRDGELYAEVERRATAESRTLNQVQRLGLLHRITRAMAERQDLQSIAQVMLSSVADHMPADFVCLCRYDEAARLLRITNFADRGLGQSVMAGLEGRATISIDENDLKRTLEGILVYEPRLDTLEAPFLTHLADSGLGALVAAPMRLGEQLYGLLFVARRRAESFTSTDNEFLLQLAEHVALAAHQAELRDKLQSAYDDLRSTQDVVMQQERLRALGQMASGIAHDINNAISPVSLYTQSLLRNEPSLSDNVRKYLQTVGRVIDDVGATVGRMREFYRGREGEVVLAPVDLNEIATQVLELTRARWSDMAHERGIVITAETDLAAALPRALGVESEIREALTNLIFNAVDAMPNGGTLRVRTAAVDFADGSARRVMVEVADSGIGMDEETLRRCREPFFTTKGDRGTGLGLAMVHGIVERHRAGFDIESAPGKGTVMRLSFAAAPDDAAADAPAKAAAPSLRALRLLVVDDDPFVLESTVTILEIEGHSATAATGGQAGIEAFAAAAASDAPYDAVITDLGMPYVDGHEVARSVKAVSPQTPVLLLTGWGQRGAATLPPHVDYVLPKPPDMGQLLDILKAAVPN